MQRIRETSPLELVYQVDAPTAGLSITDIRKAFQAQDFPPNLVKGLRVGFSPQYKVRVLTRPTNYPRYFPRIHSNSMAQIESFGPRVTSVSFPWPAEVTGLERIVLSAQGDLQRILSAFFARPISVETIFAQTYTQKSLDDPRVPLSEPSDEVLFNVSPSSPISQTRQVHLQCANSTVCTATSTVRISSPQHAHLFLVEKYAIGQMFRKLGTIPQFELVEVGLGSPDIAFPESKSTDASTTVQPLWRRYRLSIPDFECEIVEVFPNRDMFTHGDEWLLGDKLEPRQPSIPSQVQIGPLQTITPLCSMPPKLVIFVGAGFFLILALQIFLISTGRLYC
ncbi:Poxc laccase transcription factor [Pleurotus pulmonarius]